MRPPAGFAALAALLFLNSAPARAGDPMSWNHRQDPRDNSLPVDSEREDAGSGPLQDVNQGAAPITLTDHGNAAADLGVSRGQGSGRVLEGQGGGLSVGVMPPLDDGEDPPPRSRPPQTPESRQKSQSQTGPIQPDDQDPRSPKSRKRGTPSSGINWGASGKNGERGAGEAEDKNSVSQKAIGQATKSAVAMIESFKARESGMSDLPAGGGARAPGMAGTMGGMGKARGSGPEFAHAAGVFRDAFKAVGLTPAVGPDGRTILKRSDGKEATPEDLAALKARIDREPRLLASNPNLFRTISREQYGQLQRDYENRPELKRTSFKHVAMTDDKRDFLWSRNCQPVSGDCNKAAKAAYKEHQPVSAEELGRILDGIEQEAGAEDAKGFNASRLGGSGLESFSSMLKSVLAGFGSGPAASAGGAVYADGGGGKPSGVAVNAEGPRSGLPGRGGKSAPPALILAAALPERGPSRSMAALLIMAGAILLVAAAWARRRA